MKVKNILLLALFLTAGCDSPPGSTGGGTPSASPQNSAKGSAAAAASQTAAPTASVKVMSKTKLAMLTPLPDAKVFPDVDVAIAWDGAVPAGTLMAVLDGDAVEAGQPLAADDKHIVLDPKTNLLTTKLAVGEHTVLVQHVSEGGKATAFATKTSKFTVVKDEGPRSVAFLAPADGATVKSPFKVKFGAKGIKVIKAGLSPVDRISGHHHILVNVDSDPVGTVVKADKQHIHFGKAQLETDLTLPKGKHKLTLQFADGSHRSYGPKLTATINVTVQ